MARKTEYHVLYKTPEKAAKLAAKNTEDKEKQKRNQENKQSSRNGQESRRDSSSARRMGENATIFDDVLKTIQEKMPEFAIPLINEAFGTAYPLDAEVVRCEDEYPTRRGKRIVDLHLLIGGKRYHLECQIRNDGRMIIRMWEYDTAIALEHAEKKDGRYHLYYPHACVLQLRGKHKFDKMKMVLHLPDGQSCTYSVPVIWLSDYTSDEIFQKRLLFLLPYYIIKYEKQIHRLERDERYLQEMLAEYRRIEEYLEKELLEKDCETAYRDMIELINRLADYVMRDSQKVKQEVENVMGGRVLKLQTDYLIEQGRAQGRTQGEKIGADRISELYKRLFENGRSDDLRRAFVDEVYRKKLLKEYGI